jgi:hypothetical protein
MVDRYSHIRLEAKKSAFEALSRRGNATIMTQKAATTERLVHNLLTLLVGAWGFEPKAYFFKTS